MNHLRDCPDRTASPSQIAVDGPAGVGKSVVSQRVARALDYLYVDTGIIYRVVTLVAMRRNIDPEDGERLGDVAAGLDIEMGIPKPTEADGRLQTIAVDGEDVSWLVFDPQVSSTVSVVSAHRSVRAALLPLQRSIARTKVVMVGRDIGTTVLPDAGLKVFLDASPETRAHRRWLQLQERGTLIEYSTVLSEIRCRDEIDRKRPVAPLCVAPDAVVINTDELTIEETVERVLHQASDRKRGC